MYLQVLKREMEPYSICITSNTNLNFEPDKKEKRFQQYVNNDFFDSIKNDPPMAYINFQYTET